MPEPKKANKKADLLQIDKVPVLNTDKQTLEEYLMEIMGYCYTLHDQIKEHGFSKENAQEFWYFMMKNSSEPQYLLMVYIFTEKKILEQEGKILNDISGKALAGLLTKIEDLRSYVNSLKQLTYRDVQVRAVAEYYYSKGLSVNEAVKKLMSAKTLLKYDEWDVDFEYEKTEANTKKIQRYYKSFKNYDVQKVDSKRHPFDS